MKPGRELDALVAEKVFGQKIDLDWLAWVKRGEPAGAFGTPMMGVPIQEINDHFMTTRDFALIDVPLPYSTDIAAAWEVVEKLRSIILQDTENSEGRKVYEVEFCVPGRGAFVIAESAPYAICLAALKAVGVKIE